MFLKTVCGEEGEEEEEEEMVNESVRKGKVGRC